MIISTSNINEIRKLIQNAKDKPIIVLAQTNELNRKVLEFGKFDILLSVESLREKQKDKLKQLDSGLNHVLAKIAAKNGVSIGIDIEEISRLEKKDKAIRLARIKQNIKICRKAKCGIVIVNGKDAKNSFDFLISLGASSQQAKKAVENS